MPSETTLQVQARFASTPDKWEPIIEVKWPLVLDDAELSSALCDMPSFCTFGNRPDVLEWRVSPVDPTAPASP